MSAATASVLLLASEMQDKQARVVRALDERAVAGLASGSGRSINPKRWVCEDSLALLGLPDGARLAAVADAHFGGFTSESVARQLRSAWEDSGSGGSSPERLRKVIHTLAQRVSAERPAGDPSETTALVAHLDGLELSWGSVGDSFLFVISGPGRCERVNRLGPLFIGGGPLPPILPQDLLSSGRVTLQPDDVVLLASDGIEPQTSALEGPDLARELRRPVPLEQRLGRLLQLASDGARGAGLDNVGLVALSAAG